ncbi:MAG: hypothetical protein ACK4TL_08350 [Hyphomicrobiaceae bacterium]
MTSISDPRAASEMPSGVPDRMPRAVRLGLALTLGGLVLGALYLVAVRGEALLVDLAALGGRLWCF